MNFTRNVGYSNLSLLSTLKMCSRETAICQVRDMRQSPHPFSYRKLIVNWVMYIHKASHLCGDIDLKRSLLLCLREGKPDTLYCPQSNRETSIPRNDKEMGKLSSASVTRLSAKVTFVGFITGSRLKSSLFYRLVTFHSVILWEACCVPGHHD